MKKKRKKNGKVFRIMGAAIAAIGALRYWAVMKGRDERIILSGIKAWEASKGFAEKILGVGIILLAIGSVLYLVSLSQERQEQKKTEREKQEAKAKPKPKKEAALAMKGRLDGGTLRKVLCKFGTGQWGQVDACDSAIMEILRQMDAMDACQERLHNLLEANDASSLGNMEEVVDGVEQYMFRCIRKACNYMQAYSPDSEGSIKKVRGGLEMAVTENKKQLSQAQEFLGLIADFLNEQGNDEQGLELLDIYKKTILDSISQEPEEKEEEHDGERTGGIKLTL